MSKPQDTLYPWAKGWNVFVCSGNDQVIRVLNFLASQVLSTSMIHTRIVPREGKRTDIFYYVN